MKNNIQRRCVNFVLIIRELKNEQNRPYPKFVLISLFPFFLFFLFEEKMLAIPYTTIFLKPIGMVQRKKKKSKKSEGFRR